MPTTRILLPCNTFHTQCRLYRHFSRPFSSEARKLKPDADTENKAYSDTLLLPKTHFKLHPDLKEVERKYRKLTCDELYRWQVWGTCHWIQKRYSCLFSGRMQKDLSLSCLTDLHMLMVTYIWVSPEILAVNRVLSHSCK